LYDVSAATREGVACTEQFFKGKGEEKREKKSESFTRSVQKGGMQERATRRLLFPRTRHLAPQTDCASRSKYKDGRTKAGQIRSKRTGRHRRKKGRGGHACHIRKKEREVEKGKFERQTEQNTEKREGWKEESCS